MTQTTSSLHIDLDAYAPSIAGWRDYLALLKPRVMTLVVFTAFAGLVLAPEPINPFLGLLAIVSIAVGGGASGALNMWYEAEIDARMQRTKARPIPAKIIRRDEALVFALLLAAFAVLTMGLFLNWFAAGFLAFTIFFYAVVYTIWLKPSTPQNIVIGGAAGAFPPMIGWAAATGGVSVESFVLFLIIFMWTPPHFWALSLFSTTDYHAAGIPMLPNVRGVEVTKRQIVFYSWGMAVVGVAPALLGFASLFYGVMALILGAVFIFYAHRLQAVQAEEATKRAAKKLFFLSLFYLFALFALLLLERLALALFTLIAG